MQNATNCGNADITRRLLAGSGAGPRKMHGGTNPAEHDAAAQSNSHFLHSSIAVTPVLVDTPPSLESEYNCYQNRLAPQAANTSREGHTTSRNSDMPQSLHILPLALAHL